MDVTKFLKKSKVPFEITKHHPTFSAQRMAAEEHEPGRYVAKPVVVKADDKFIMCVLPACHKINLNSLKRQLGAKSVRLAEEKDMEKLFSDCELGAEPPFGNLYELPTVMDKSLQESDHILFQSGTHKKAVRMRISDYLKLATPKILEFSCHESLQV